MSYDRVPAVGSTVPNSARIYNYLLGGKDNYLIDREVADRLLAIAPDTKTIAWFVRKFMVLAVEMAADAGVRQFIDLGAGIPTWPSVQETAREIHSDVRVVYVDNDPVAFAHCDALLADEAGVTALKADMRQPEDIIEQLKIGDLIDFAEPVCLLSIGVMHYVMDDEDPYGSITKFRDLMVPGSYLALVHAAADTHPAVAAQLHDDTNNSPAQLTYRTKAQIEEFFDGFDMIDPGVNPVQEWLTDNLPASRMAMLGGELPATQLVMLGGIGRLP